MTALTGWLPAATQSVGALLGSVVVGAWMGTSFIGLLCERSVAA